MGKMNPQYALQRRQHRHEEKMALLKIFQSDPEMKYYLGALTGSAMLTVSAMSTGVIKTLNDDTSESTATVQKPTTSEIASYSAYKAIKAGPFGGVLSLYELGFGKAPTIKKVQAATGDSDIVDVGTFTGTGETGIFGFVNGIVGLMGAGFGGFCMAVLLLKAIFGDEDVASIMSGTGALVDAAVPL